MEYERFVKARAVECFEIRVFLWSHEREENRQSQKGKIKRKIQTKKAKDTILGRMKMKRTKIRD